MSRKRNNKETQRVMLALEKATARMWKSLLLS